MSDYSHVKLLLVDDEELIREVLSDVFSDVGINALQASNGLDAYNIITQVKIDVVITDAKMPGGDGISLAKNIELLPDPKPGVFICSGFNDLRKDELAQLKVVKIFDKPFQQKEVVKDVIEYLKLKNIIKD